MISLPGITILSNQVERNQDIGHIGHFRKGTENVERWRTTTMATGDFRRRYDRKNYLTDVVFSLNGRSYSGTLKDISLGGAFVVTGAMGNATKGDEVTISIPFTNGRNNVKRRAKILWANREGFALEFL